jgi:hypothetical protein
MKLNWIGGWIATVAAVSAALLIVFRDSESSSSHVFGLTLIALYLPATILVFLWRKELKYRLPWLIPASNSVLFGLIVLDYLLKERRSHFLVGYSICFAMSLTWLLSILWTRRRAARPTN